MPSSRKPRGIIARADGEKRKRFPDGLKATIKSIRKFWPGDVRPGDGRSVERFATKFQPAYNASARRYSYKLVDAEHVGSLASILRRLEGSGEKNLSDISFYKMRAFAEYVEVPTSLLVLFAQCVSYEAQGRGRDHVLRFIRECQASIDALETYLREQDNDSTALHEPRGPKGGGEYLARLAGLSRMAGRYSRTYVYEGRRDKLRATRADGA
jgi:hypothetical protein